jgi:ribonuclease P protein subunit RPR2
MEELAHERINILFDEAKKASDEGRFDDASRYVQLARVIGMRYNVRLNSAQKHSICKKCGAYLVPGENVRVRVLRGRIIRTCKCGAVTRIPLKKKR